MSNYCIKYREKKRFNWFNPWITYCYTWNISLDSFDPHQPHLFPKYESALEEAKRLKNDPELIDKNNEERWKRYNDLCEDLRKYRRRETSQLSYDQ